MPGFMLNLWIVCLFTLYGRVPCVVSNSETFPVTCLEKQRRYKPKFWQCQIQTAYRINKNLWCPRTCLLCWIIKMYDCERQYPSATCVAVLFCQLPSCNFSVFCFAVSLRCDNKFCRKKLAMMHSCLPPDCNPNTWPLITNACWLRQLKKSVFL